MSAEPESTPGVARLTDVPPGELLAVTAPDGTRVLLANVDGEVHAVANECSHEFAPLEDGELEDDTVVCPWHFSRFCLRSGKALDMPAVDPVATYPVTVIGDEVFLGPRRGDG
ncbi:non-heme iron oxygenase ferredoxin subunit [Streptomyces kaniharaensis]|uniref:Non-heme iron oxygenase ferredoxin subunit n=1 Tax=Streptomyces kaniharaensis TaxID=212423 RepID=A0A6N7KYU0_9ACTN|nr:non-heme iron oxygenase ferredoxin subunit [Streptomyces kaniharaensis]MQS15537.1 non-heme iron oxygenase ferredoxin subunit [Streptomyces kaniharaensis]